MYGTEQNCNYFVNYPRFKSIIIKLLKWSKILEVANFEGEMEIFYTHSGLYLIIGL